MPQSEHVHKSMLLRGVKFPTSILDRGDIDGVRNRSARGGRSYGGAPLHVDNYRPGHNNHNNNNNNNNGYRGNNYRGGYDRQHHRTPYTGNVLNPENPFAAHLNQNFAPGAWSSNSFPPPPLPPPPQVTGWGMQAPHHNSGSSSHSYGYGKNDRGGMGQYWQTAPRNYNGYGGRGGQGRDQGSHGYGRGGNSYDANRGHNNYYGRSRGGNSYGR